MTNPAPPETSRGARAQGVWGTLRSVVPRWNAPVKPSSEARGSPVSATASAVADRPCLERASASGPGTGASTPTSTHEPAIGTPAGPDFGYPRGLHKKYKVLQELGRGGNGVVYAVEELATGAQFALKSIPKVLPPNPKISDA